MANTPRGYRKLADGEGDKAQAVNDALDDIDDDVQQIADGLGTVQGSVSALNSKFDTGVSSTVTIGTKEFVIVEGLITEVNDI